MITYSCEPWYAEGVYVITATPDINVVGGRVSLYVAHNVVPENVTAEWLLSIINELTTVICARHLGLDYDDSRG